MQVSVDTAANYTAYMEKAQFIEKVQYDGTVEWDLRIPYKNLRHILHHKAEPKIDLEQQAIWDEKGISL